MPKLPSLVSHLLRLDPLIRCPYPSLRNCYMYAHRPRHQFTSASSALRSLVAAMGHDADADASPPSAASSLKQRLRSSICLSCCFRGAASGGGGNEDRPASLIRSSTVWLRAKAKELPEIGGTCRGLVARVGRHHHGGRRHACDCRYDPLSYSLNFDEGPDDDLAAAGEQPLQHRGFSSRLPPSPPPTAPPPPRPAVGISC